MLRALFGQGASLVRVSGSQLLKSCARFRSVAAVACGILVSFLARHNPIAIIFVAILFGGIVASGGLIQRRMDLPDATVLLLQGLTFVVLLVSETLYGRFEIFKVKTNGERT